MEQKLDYFNDSSIDYIRKTGMVILNNKEFDIIGRLKDYFCKVSETILKLDNPNEKITPDMIKLVDDNEQEKLVLNYKKKIELETFYGDIFSELSRNPKFIPEYHIISNDDKYVQIYLELPGEIKNFKVDVKFHDNNTRVIIRGKRDKIQEKTMGRNFGSGDIELKIPLRGRDGDLTGKVESTKDLKNGFYVINLVREKS